jgi:hypothetical protein
MELLPEEFYCVKKKIFPSDYKEMLSASFYKEILLNNSAINNIFDNKFLRTLVGKKNKSYKDYLKINQLIQFAKWTEIFKVQIN